jgi:hypothetical protein
MQITIKSSLRANDSESDDPEIGIPMPYSSPTPTMHHEGTVRLEIYSRSSEEPRKRRIE